MEWLSSWEHCFIIVVEARADFGDGSGLYIFGPGYQGQIELRRHCSEVAQGRLPERSARLTQGSPSSSG